MFGIDDFYKRMNGGFSEDLTTPNDEQASAEFSSADLVGSQLAFESYLRLVTGGSAQEYAEKMNRSAQLKHKVLGVDKAGGNSANIVDSQNVNHLQKFFDLRDSDAEAQVSEAGAGPIDFQSLGSLGEEFLGLSGDQADLVDTIGDIDSFADFLNSPYEQLFKDRKKDIEIMG